MTVVDYAMLQNIVSHANDYAAALLVASTAVASVIRILGLEQTPVGSRIVAVCFDVVGLVKGHQAPPEAK